MVRDPHRPLRALLIAEAANPDFTSVPLVGWSHAKALSEVVDAHVVTQVRNRDAIVAQGWTEGREFTALDTERLARPLWQVANLLRGGKGKGWTTVTAVAALAYYYFEARLWREFGPRIRAHEFDVVHRITPLSPTIPSTIAKRCRRAGVPFVIGPLNGGVPWPKQFEAARRREREWLSYLRRAHRLMPAYRATYRNAAAIVAASRHNYDELARRFPEKTFYLPENGIDPADSRT